MKLLSRPSAAAIALVALALLAVLSPGCSSSGEPQTGSAATSDTIICGFYPDVSATGEAIDRPEFYLLSAMNRKLQYYPDFAAAAGMSSVADCAGARQVYRAYSSFSQAHPHFDENMPLPKLPRLHDLVPKVAGVATVPKVFNGTQMSFFPTVFLSYTIPAGATYFDGSVGPHGKGPGGTHRCSGAFIAKNWILTAAHCLTDVALQAGDNGEPSHWITATLWNIQWPNANGMAPGVPGSMGLTTFLLSLPDQNFIGIENPNATEAANLKADVAHHPFNDAALLYVDAEENDGALPPMSTQPDGTPSWLAVSTVPPQTDWTLTAYGYGALVRPAVPVLTSGDISGSFQLSGTTANGWVLDNNFIAETIPSGGFSFTSLCHGDSGGPLVHDFGGGTLGIVGIASSIFATDRCAHLPGDGAAWVRADIEAPFIQKALQSTYGSDFECTPGPAGPGNPNNLFIDCQGPPCQSDCDCDSNSFCSNPAVLDPSSIFQTGESVCVVCADGTCNCIKGQCLPRPNDFEGGDMNSDASCEGGP